MDRHPEIAIKVNATVDKAIAPLVLALNRFDGLITVDSCQGKRKYRPYVYFKYGRSAKDLAVFCSELAARLHAKVKGSNGYALRVEWNYDFSTNIAILETDGECVRELSGAVATVANDFHKSESSRGKSRTGLRSSQRRRTRQHVQT